MPDDNDVRKRVFGPKAVVVLTLLALLVLFALLNTDDVHVDYIVDSARASLILVIVVSAVLGGAIGWLFGRRDRHDY